MAIQSNVFTGPFALTNEGIVAALGYTPVNKAGDTGVGALSLSGALTFANAGSDSKWSSQRTGGKTYSFEHDASQFYFWNSTDGFALATFTNTGEARFSGNGGTEALRTIRTASAVNRVEITGAITGSMPSVAANGSDANIDLRLLPKGTGLIRFGTHSAIGAETVTGYITMKDDGGTSRKVAIVS